MYITALNAIHRSKKAKPSFVAPGEVVELSGDELKRVLEAGAGREATDDELILARHKGQISKTKVADDSDDDVEKQAVAEAKKQAAAEAKKQAAADAKKQTATEATKQASPEDGKKQSGDALDLD